MPGILPIFKINSGTLSFLEVSCLNVSSYKITPPIHSFIPDALNSASLNDNLFLGVDWTSTASNLLDIVPVLSSAAADESTGTMSKRLEAVEVQSTPKNRLSFREALFSASGMNECIGGVILYDETLRQETSKKDKVPELILNMGSMPGIKVDTGAKTLAGSENEKITEGLQ